MSVIQHSIYSIMQNIKVKKNVVSLSSYLANMSGENLGEVQTHSG